MADRQYVRIVDKNFMRIAQIGVLTAISVVLIVLIRIPFGFLEYDMADVPIILGGMLFGPHVGLTILLVVSLIQAFLFGGNGWVGLVMHFVASGAMVVIVSLFYRHKKQLSHTIIGMVVGVLAMTLLMIPMNFIFTVHFFGVPQQALIEMLVPLIIPFNLGKGAVNCLLAGLLFKALMPFLRKHSGMLYID